MLCSLQTFPPFPLFFVAIVQVCGVEVSSHRKAVGVVAPESFMKAISSTLLPRTSVISTKDTTDSGSRRYPNGGIYSPCMIRKTCLIY